MYLCIIRHSVNKCPHSNSLDSFDFAMRHQFRECHNVQIIETASILHFAMGVLDDDIDERVHVAANDSRHDTADHSLVIVH